MRYFFIDRILEYKQGESAKAVKNITLSEDIFDDHFPDLPIYPGAYLIESAAQLGGFLVEMTVNKPEVISRAMMGQVDQAKFYRAAEPGDQLLLEACLENIMEDAAKICVHISCSGTKVARVFLTFILKRIDNLRIHEQRRSLYTLWTKHIEDFPEIL
ncbi:MAG: beta-hydroxyacyl-ACP dehydratase [Proteobacteria bacterium]|nr:beta-hydroxyacyl-ACP dehydratase [Pseudomonadota bacterium]MBU1708505.1 beta-hydroxyacyl-ACP dehydratase [Pseudomonadota bacterium]